MPRTRKKPDVVEFTLSGKVKYPGISEIIKDIFAASGVRPETLVECEKGQVVEVSAYLKSKLKAQRLKERVGSLKLRKVSMRLKILSSQNWEERWKEEWRPFSLTEDIDVVPAWQRKRYKKTRRQPLYIDTVTAFGTGLHETTKFMAQLIRRCRRRFKSFLDVGTGSGILSIVAYIYGAESAWAVDIDRHCIVVAKKNLQTNGYRFQRTVAGDVAGVKSGQRFDFVAANLITHDLIKLKRKIYSFVKPGKYLAVSGVSLENLKDLKRAYSALPLRCLKIRKGRKWAAILYKRIK